MALYKSIYLLTESSLCDVQERYVFKYFLGDLVKKAKSNGINNSSSSEVGSAKVEKTKDVEFEEAVRDLKISWIGKSVVSYFCVFTETSYLLWLAQKLLFYFSRFVIKFAEYSASVVFLIHSEIISDSWWGIVCGCLCF